MTNFKEVKISEIFDLSINTNSSFFTKSFINKNRGEIPVYSASKDRNLIGYGYVKDDIKLVKYFENCLTWNIDGSIGKAFYRKGRFSLSEKVIPLVLFEKYNGKIDLNYISFEIEISCLKEGFGFSKKAGKGRIKNLFVKIPVKKTGEFELEKQKEIVKKYEKLEILKDRIRIMKEDLENQNISLEDTYNGMEKNLKEVFDIKQGDAFYTKKRILENNWIGEIPVYSSNTKEEGLLIGIKKEFIKGKDLYYQNCLTWSIDGYAGKLFARNTENINNVRENKHYFTINNHCGILLPKKDGLYLPFIKIILQHKFFEKAKGYGNNKLGNNQIEDIFIKIPTKENGQFDLEKQKEIAEKHEKIEKIQKTLIEELEYLEKVKVEI